MAILLKFVIKFCKSNNNVKEYLESFFLEFVDDCTVSISDPKTLSFDGIYESDVVEIEVNFNYFPTESPRSLISRIVQDWCDEDKNDLSNLWLSFVNASILENDRKLCHSDVVVKEIAFGTFPDMQHFMQHYHYESNSDENEIKSIFMHNQKECLVFSSFSHTEFCEQEKYSYYKFQFTYASICHIVVNYVPECDIVHIYFHLKHIPALFAGKTKQNERKNFANIPIVDSVQEYQDMYWNRTLEFGCDCKESLCCVRRIGRCPIFKMVFPKMLITHDIVERLIQKCPTSTTFYFSNIKTVYSQVNFEDVEQFPLRDDNLQEYGTNEKENIIFKCQFAWQTLLSRSQEVRDQILLNNESVPEFSWSNLKRKLILFSVTDVDALVNTLYVVSEMITKCFIFHFQDVLSTLFSYHCKNKRIQDVPDGMCLVRRIIISPSRIICLQPSEHFKNRVIRKILEKSSENLLRVSIQDDDFSKLTFAVQKVFGSSEKTEFMRRVVKTFLLNGIQIGPRIYEFLASSNSQLREHGVWMFAKDHKGNSVQSIRKWMGDFSPIKNVAKYMARMGQCFSTSDEAVQIQMHDNEVHQLADMKTRDEKYVFSDGVGMISKDLAREVREGYSKSNDLVHASKKYLYDPSAFQIRFKGCKGMVAEVDSKYLSGRKIGIRPSMEKFHCDSSNDLEVVKISAPRAVFLNRQIITILESLGVEENVFLDLQKKMIFDLIDSLMYDKKAYKMLEKSTSLDFPFKKLSNAGISIVQEPFFRSLLLSVYKSKIENLKCKARIAVPHKYGRNMMGVVDETRTLRYGEIFAQYSEKVSNIKSQTKVLKGPVIITTHPCMHPGDVRKLKAVDVPALHHIKDCIVFPARGDRPHPDEMAGSDLDGDEYVLIWEPRLIFPGQNISPMNYLTNEEVILDKDIEVEDMIDFICQYIQDDNIGPMANAHLAWADSDSYGVFSDVCMDIAKKYPHALDFAKSGTTCTLDYKERPKLYPDFMGKGCGKDNYKSQNTLGSLYRDIRVLETSVSNIDYNLTIEPDQQLEVRGWRLFEQLATKRKHEYSERVQKFLRRYGLLNEAEVLTGYVSKVNEYDSNRYDRENAATLSRKYLIDTIQRFKLKFSNDCLKYSVKLRLRLESSKKLLKMKMASAWYMVTYQDPDAVCLSFPWVVTDVLLQIQNQNREGGNLLVSESSFISTVDKNLESKFHGLLDWIKSNSTCLCVIIMIQIMKEWMTTSSFFLTSASEHAFCYHCLQRIIENFKSSNMECCSFNKDFCSCEENCSPIKLILECFKYYASDVAEKLGSCEEILYGNVICQGLHVTNLRSLALKTYAAVAITHNLQYFGVESFGSPDIQFDSYEEGDPIRIPVTNEFEQILTGNVNEVCKILQDLSGVKKVLLDGNSVRENGYLLLSSVGTSFQRWNLEELIMEPNIAANINDRMTA